MHENYWKTLDKMHEVLNCWCNRSLTLQGKVTVVNSLISSLLVYKFLSLPTPDHTFFVAYKRMITEDLRKMANWKQS